MVITVFPVAKIGLFVSGILTGEFISKPTNLTAAKFVTFTLHRNLQLSFLLTYHIHFIIHRLLFVCLLFVLTLAVSCISLLMHLILYVFFI